MSTFKYTLPELQEQAEYNLGKINEYSNLYEKAKQAMLGEEPQMRAELAKVRDDAKYYIDFYTKQLITANAKIKLLSMIAADENEKSI